MKVEIFSKSEMIFNLEHKFADIKNAAVIAFYDPDSRFDTPVDYEKTGLRHILVPFKDIDADELPKEIPYNKAFPQAAEVAQFFYDSINLEYAPLICQCEYGESRSAGCAAAIMQYFDQDALKIFTDYFYYPNKLIYHNLLEALRHV
ncbi:MAG: hypothetical protein IJR45_03065 [Firmicutes bacterium]|nr:hypothetical protein [Bacillota bacterium]MBQ9604373.1 hypothetical protein [Bacillota bacterium]